MNPRTRRLHRFHGVGPLAERPCDGRGIDGVRAFEVELAGERARVVAHRPEIAGRPPGASALFASPAHPRRAVDAPQDPRVTFEWDGSTLRAQIAFPEGTSCYGTGMVAGPLLRDGRVAEFWNTDAWQYGESPPALYSSHPYVLCVLPDGRAVGVLGDSFRRGACELAPDGVELQFEAEPAEVLCIEGAGPAEVTSALTALVGRPELPPLYALGYHQCRWSYMSADELRELAREFERRDLPCDALWLDIDYMDRRRVFTFDPERFGDPRALTGDLRARGLRSVAILDPGVVADPDDGTFAEGLAGAHFVLAERGDEPVLGRVWPGVCAFPDFTDAGARAFWARRVQHFLDASAIDGLWVDMNEPSVFRSPARTLPAGARHRGELASGPAGEGEEPTRSTEPAGTHGRCHNVYGHLMADATLEGMRAARPERRPFLLTRSSHLGTARLAATWTGDNQATWEDLRWSVSMVLNLGLSGQRFSGPDIGGFDGDPDRELFVRWFELGALLPFCRGHSERSACRKEPWAFGPRAEEHVRRALRRRMQLLPTLYTLFADAALPPVRPVFFADPADARLRAVDDAFLLGDDLLVAPVVEPGAEERTVLLPASPGGWYAWPDGGERLTAKETIARAPLGELPVFVRAGTVVCEAEVRRTTEESRTAPLVLRVFPDTDGRAEGLLYEDEGEGYGYREGRARKVRLRARVRGDEVDVEWELLEGRDQDFGRPGWRAVLAGR